MGSAAGPSSPSWAASTSPGLVALYLVALYLVACAAVTLVAVLAYGETRTTRRPGTGV